MYGKLFASTFTGSMMGAGAETFAVWGYAIANADSRGFVELNPRLLAAVIGSTPQAMSAAIDVLASPDPESRTKNEDGRRVIREGTFICRIVNYPEYRGMRDEEERRAYQRTWAKNKRSKSLDAVDRSRPESTQGEGEEEGKEEGRSESPPDPIATELRPGPVTGHELKRLFAAIREREVPGTLPWQTPIVRDGKDTSMAEMINADPTARADVAPTMTLLLKSAEAGQRGNSSKLITGKPAFGFACWISDWTSLREELRGAAGRKKTKMELAQEAEAASWANR